MGPFRGAPSSSVSSPDNSGWIPHSAGNARRKPRQQTEQCVRQLEFIMKAAGGTLDDIIKTTVYLMEGTDRAAFLDAYTEQFRRRLRSPWLPTGLTMELEAMRTDCVVEIDAVAWLGAR